MPLIALLLGGWMIFRAVRDHGPEVTIEFEDGTGVEAGKTQLKHKGSTVGTVTSVDMKPDLSGVIVRVQLQKSAAALARRDSRFWIVRPEIGFSGVTGLDTLLTGVQLAVRPGEGDLAENFTGLEKAPPPVPSKQGRSFFIQSDRLGSLNPGSPVFYREVKVGEVEASRLADDATSVLIRFRVESAYADLVRTDSRFWNAGGFSFKVGLLGAELKNTSLESLVSGGIAFATPEPSDKNGPLAPAAKEETVFKLQTEPEKDWLNWRPKISIRPEESGPDQNPAPKDLSDVMKAK
ncbi:intermembrane transport protein PqiB [Nibricoccus aquaticus]|uniref:PqiB family protein n=1 Tax=Nibricoccus aquaticus TaxID=2576891 RepID=UPI001586CA1C|nr:MlaD family protein [Nibricoccus aquaticus]